MPITYYTTAEVTALRNKQAVKLKKKFGEDADRLLGENQVLTMRIQELEAILKNEPLCDKTLRKLKRWIDHYPSCKMNTPGVGRCSCGLEKAIGNLT